MIKNVTSANVYWQNSPTFRPEPFVATWQPDVTSSPPWVLRPRPRTSLLVPSVTFVRTTASTFLPNSRTKRRSMPRPSATSSSVLGTKNKPTSGHAEKNIIFLCDCMPMSANAITKCITFALGKRTTWNHGTYASSRLSERVIKII